jgi:hypothetical protein
MKLKRPQCMRMTGMVPADQARLAVGMTGITVARTGAGQLRAKRCAHPSWCYQAGAAARARRRPKLATETIEQTFTPGQVAVQVARGDVRPVAPG